MPKLLRPIAIVLTVSTDRLDAVEAAPAALMGDQFNAYRPPVHSSLAAKLESGPGGAGMPIYRLLQNSAFEPEHIQAMEQAFEETLAQLGLVDRADPLVEHSLRARSLS
jgi:hypothetical protein